MLGQLYESPDQGTPANSKEDQKYHRGNRTQYKLLNQMTIHGGNAITMTSLEISEITGKRHDNVMRDTRTMPVELHGESNLLKFEGVYVGGAIFSVARTPARMASARSVSMATASGLASAGFRKRMAIESTKPTFQNS